MVKYVDTGLDDLYSNDDAFGTNRSAKYGNNPSTETGIGVGGGNKKKKSIKKGFKVDRRANFERMMARKAGLQAHNNNSNINRANTNKLNNNSNHVRVKSIVFNETDRREYLLSLHKKKNERRVQAFVDAKRKLRKESAKTRREQREEARRAYNNYASVPILPNYTYRLPTYEENMNSEDSDSGGDDGGGVNSDDVNAEQKVEKRKRLMQREKIFSNSTHEVPWAMMHDELDNDTITSDEHNNKEEISEKNAISDKNKSSICSNNNNNNNNGPGRVSNANEVITVEVKPLFTNRYTITSQSNASGQNVESTESSAQQKQLKVKENVKFARTLPNNDFSDLPSIVEEELRKLRQTTKGPAHTPARVKMLKELEKIRKIKKHSRKGHGKRSASGKRKNRRK